MAGFYSVADADSHTRPAQAQVFDIGWNGRTKTEAMGVISRDGRFAHYGVEVV